LFPFLLIKRLASILTDIINSYITPKIQRFTRKHMFYLLSFSLFSIASITSSIVELEIPLSPSYERKYIESKSGRLVVAHRSKLKPYSLWELGCLAALIINRMVNFWNILLLIYVLENIQTLYFDFFLSLKHAYLIFSFEYLEIFFYLIKIQNDKYLLHFVRKFLVFLEFGLDYI